MVVDRSQIPGLQASLAAAMILYILYMIITLAIFLYHRQHAAVRAREPFLTTVSCLSTLIPMTMLLLLSANLQPTFSCLALVWCFNALFPLWFSSFFLRAYILMHRYFSAERAAGLSGNFLKQSVSVKQSSTMISIQPESTQSQVSSTLESASRPKLTKWDDFVTEYLVQTRSHKTLSFQCKAVALSLLIQAAIATAVVLNSPYSSNDSAILQAYLIQQPCYRLYGWEFYPLYCIILFYCVFAAPILYVILRKIRDAHNICTELMFDFPFGGTCAIILMLHIVLPQLQTIHYYVNGAWYIALTLFCTHFLNVVRPLLEIRHEKVSQSKFTLSYDQIESCATPFTKLLADPDEYDAFKQFCITEFSVENVLFYEAYISFHKEFDVTLSQKWNDAMRKRCERVVQKIYDSFFRFDNDEAPLLALPKRREGAVKKRADYELNITSKCRNDIRSILTTQQDLDQHQLMTVFDSAYKHIYRMMEIDSFSRFTKRRKQNNK